MLCWQRGCFGSVVRIGVQHAEHGPLDGRTVVALGNAEEKRWQERSRASGGVQQHQDGMGGGLLSGW